MERRLFNSLMPIYNERWVAKVLNMNVNSEKGPDVIDNEKAIEVKFKVQYSNGRYAHKCWKVLGWQLDYNKNFKKIYWGLGFYTLNKEVKNIKDEALETLVKYRELYVVEWDWMRQFYSYHQKGKTEISEWDHYMLYPKFKLLPETILSKEVEGGKIHLTENIDVEDFSFLETDKKEELIPF